MSVDFNTKDFLRAWNVVSPAAKSRTTKPVLTYVLLTGNGGRARLQASDGSQSVFGLVRDSFVGSSMLLPAARFSQVLSQAGETFSLVATDSGVTVKTGRSKFNLSTESAEGFPFVGEFDSSRASSRSVSCEVLLRAIKTAICAIDAGSVRYALGGVLLDFRDSRQLNVVSTDGRRLAAFKLAADGGGNRDDLAVVVPPESLRSVMRMLGECGDGHCEVSANENHAVFSVLDSGFEVRTNLVEGRFPDWRRTIAKHSTAYKSTSVVLGDFLDAISSASVTVSQESKAIGIEADAGSLSFASQASGVGSSEVSIPVAWDHEKTRILVDPSNMADILRTIDRSEVLSLEIADEKSAMFIRNGEFMTAVIMPLAKD